MNIKYRRFIGIIGGVLFLVACGGGDGPPPDDSPIPPSVDPVLKKQKTRIQSFLDKRVLPFIDMESTLSQDKMNEDFPVVLTVMDNLGIAQIAFEGKQAPQQDPPVSGYRWSDHVNDLNQQYPGHFFMTANGGNSNNWAKQKDDQNSYIVQLEKAIKSGVYRLMGELEFRHYMSSSQCKDGRTDRDVTIPIDSANAHRVFKLSHDIGVPFAIHHEPEDSLIPALETMLDTYPNAKVIWAHFGQLRKPALMNNFNPALVEQLLIDHPNLYFELSTGAPNRKYFCSTGSYQAPGILDTVIWQEISPGVQSDTLTADYRSVLARFSDRFVSGADYGGNRQPFEQHFTTRIENLKLIMRDLTDEAKHNIAYKNAWYLLTGKSLARLSRIEFIGGGSYENKTKKIYQF